MKRILLSCLLCLLVPTVAFATSWAYEFVVYESNVYKVTEEDVFEIGDKLDEVTSYSDMEELSGNFSNEYQKGTAYYAINGVDPSEAIAVEIASATYKKAIYQMPYALNEQAEENEISWYMWIVISIAAVVLILIFINLRRERKNKKKGAA